MHKEDTKYLSLCYFLLRTMVVEHDQQQSIRRKLSARISAAFRIQRQPSQFMLERQRIANDNNNNNNANNNDLTPRDLLRRERRAASMAAAAASAAERAGRTPPRRSLPRGWWPDQGKREGLKLKAMDDLKNETFVSFIHVSNFIVANRWPSRPHCRSII